MRGRLTAVLFFVAALTVAIGCGGGSDDTPTSPSSETVSFGGRIQAVFNGSCVSGCHMAGGTAPFLNLTAGLSHGSLVGRPATRSSGTLVIQGSASQSVLYLRVSGTSAGSRMPEGRSPLSSSDQNAIRDWIDQGAADN